MKKPLLTVVAITAFGLTTLSTDAFAHGNVVPGRGGLHHGHIGIWNRGVGAGYYRPFVYAGASSCYRGEWIGGPKWRRYRRTYICG
jgi:hypothetical protein